MAAASVVSTADQWVVVLAACSVDPSGSEQAALWVGRWVASRAAPSAACSVGPWGVQKAAV